MNEWDDPKLHELLLAWEEGPPEETATQRLINRLSSRLKPAAGSRGRTEGQRGARESARDERRRPWLRKRWVWATVGLILALEGVFAWDRLPPKYQVPRHVLPADNGYLDFIAAGDQIKAIDEKLRQRIPYDQGQPPLTWAEAQSLAARVQPALEQARRGLRCPHIVPPHKTYTAATLFPYFAPLRELARQGECYADVQLVHGDRAGALDTYLLLLELGEQVKHGPLIAQLVGIAIQNIALSGLVNSPLAADLALPVVRPTVNDAHRQAWQAEVKAFEETEPDWTAAAEQLRRLRTHLVPLREALETEREFGLNTAYEVLSSPTPEKLFSDWSGDNSPGWWLYGRMLQAGLINRRKFFQEVETAYERIIAAGDQGKRNDHDLEHISKSNPLVRILIPEIWRAQSKVAMAHTMLALLEMQCCAAAGEKGTSLPDPFAPGQPLRERKGVFYSVGPDGQDNGGRPLSPEDFSDPDARGDVSLLSWYKPPSPPAAQAP